MCILFFKNVLLNNNIPTRIILHVTDRKRHAAFPHGWHIVMHRLRNNVHVAVFRSVLQGNQTNGIICE